jgi:hypothetical protein
MGVSPVGKVTFSTAPFYQRRGHNLEFHFAEPLTEDDVRRIREIGHWINQNYVVRLCALLESHGVVPKEGKGKICKELPGHEEIDILRRLRNEFAHSSGRYDATDPEARKLYERIVDHFRIQTDDPSSAKDYPIPIDTVLVPLTQACKRYVVAVKGEDFGSRRRRMSGGQGLAIHQRGR